MRGRPRVRRRHVHPLCEQLRTLRVAKKLTLETLARSLGYNAYTIGGWERGKISPSLASLSNWADALGVKVTIELPFKLSFPDKSKLMVSR
jgi:transcriptional regulator with XRE-family HTH domain